MNGEDILFAMTSLGFENYAEALKIYLSKYREVSHLDWIHVSINMPVQLRLTASRHRLLVARIVQEVKGLGPLLLQVRRMLAPPPTLVLRMVQTTSSVASRPKVAIMTNHMEFMVARSPADTTVLPDQIINIRLLA